ncbi:hypothetical protein ACU8KH_01622 [Lachancea thermotolerans]
MRNCKPIFHVTYDGKTYNAFLSQLSHFIKAIFYSQITFKGLGHGPPILKSFSDMQSGTATTWVHPCYPYAQLCHTSEKQKKSLVLLEKTSSKI